MYAASARNGRTLQALQIGAGWTEETVTWGNQPPTTGPAATTSSGLGDRQWNVKAQVQAMYEAGADRGGFLIRDQVEGSSEAEQSFHSKEKGEAPPHLVISFAPAGE
jgi:hypothetical protein